MRRRIMLNLWTGHYRYKGPDRLDITVKGQHPFGRRLAPTWDMVMAVKRNGSAAHSYYIVEFYKILEAVPQHVWEELLTEDEVTFVCFCGPNDFCHRNLVIEYMRDIRKFPVHYHGFRQ
jgi:hypothetical protein